jgi:hypothetical protein
MMLTLIAAAVTFTSLPLADEQDVRCLAFLSRAAGKVEGEQQRRVDAGAIWYLGRIAARSPALDPLAEVAKVLKSPSYDRAAYEADKQRCRGEMQALASGFALWSETYSQAGLGPDGATGK